MSELIGQQIAHYRIQELIGDGGMGTVYRAYDLNLDRSVALKLMHPHFARQPEFQLRLTQEAQTAAKLDHPSIVKIYNFGESDKGLYIAMEFIRDGSLRSHLQRYQAAGRYMDMNLGLQIGLQIADALDYAHRENVIHRDVKPGNIILKRLPRPEEESFGPLRAVLTDFGLVRLLTGTRITDMGVTMGTPVYMSPEQCEGREVDGRSDLYSLGAVLYEIFTNRPPFLFSSLSQAIATHIRKEEPPHPRTLRLDIPPLLDALLTKALARDPNARFASGSEMGQALRAAFFSLGNAPTRIWQRPQIEPIEGGVVDPPTGYTLTLRTPGQPLTRLPLEKRLYTIGRGPDNDIVLAVDGVSRHHARLQATPSGWSVVDLGGINGTFLQERRLPADQPTLWSVAQTLRIGPYEMLLTGPAGLETTPPVGTGSQAAPTPSSPPPAAPGPQPPRLLTLFLARENLTVDPGQVVNLNIEVENHSGLDDRVALRLHGLPPDWVRAPEEFVRVAAGERVRLTIQIRAPRRPEGQEAKGRQRFRVELVSQQHPELKVGASGSVTLGQYEAFEATLAPDEVALPGVAQVSIQNTGNVTSTYNLVGKQAENYLQFSFEAQALEVRAGQTMTTDVTLNPTQRRPLLDGRLISFEIEVIPTTGRPRPLAGRASQPPLAPAWAFYLSAFLIFCACFLTSFVIFFAPERPRLEATPTGNLTPATLVAMVTPAPDASLTPPALQTAAATLSPAPLNDNDLDQLSNSQEALVGSDPNNPDTDNDGLSDGTEVLEYGSNPLRSDTDSDGLSDFDEVTRHGTSPINSDTDGDGVSDGAEVAQGRNPRTPEIAPATPAATATLLPPVTPTPPVSTPLPTLTLTPATTPPTATAVSTSTFTPTPAASATATPTAPPPTPTATPTPSPTATPLPSLTPTATATATAVVPTPEPSDLTPIPLACQSAPNMDGVITVGEWPAAIDVILLPDNPERQTTLHLAKTNLAIYLGFVISDATFDASDSLRLYLDVQGNGGDPDSGDRFLQLGRDGARVIQAGIGNNSDGETWDLDYSSSNWLAAIESAADSWVVEVQIDLATELPSLGATWGLLVQTLFSGEGLATWPADALVDQAETWQPIDNSALCFGP